MEKENKKANEEESLQEKSMITLEYQYMMGNLKMENTQGVVHYIMMDHLQ